MAETQVASNTEIIDFLDLIYGDETGYSYIATKTPVTDNRSVKDLRWKQEFFQWPEQKNQIAQFISDKTQTHEVFYSPALFTEPDAVKENVKGASVFWCEFDGKVPVELLDIPEPSIRVQSSKPGREHWYWRLDSFQLPEKLEEVNRAIAYALGADTSGWDAGQVLRPVTTINHKRDAVVTLRKASISTCEPSEFVGIPEPPPVEKIPELESIPPIENVIPKYVFKEEVWDLFKEGLPEGKRSDGLMALGYYLAEMQLPNDEMFSMLLNADERWGKFSGRNDQHKRLMEIVVRSRIKYPYRGEGAGLETSIGFQSVLNTEINVEWVWEGFLHRQGYMLVTGPSGVGKTQFSLNAAARMVLGEGFLGAATQSTDEKIAFFSMEMGLVELKEFLKLQAKGYTPEQLEILEERLRFFPLGEPIYMTQDSEKERIENLIKEEGFTGLIFDSLGSATDGSLSSEENTKNLMDWNDTLRKRHNIFTWYIHHHRKPNGDNKRPNKLGDVYGSQYITARATSVVALWDSSSENAVQVIPLKMRLAKKPVAFDAFRDKYLHFHRKVGNIIISEKKEASENEVSTETKEKPKKIYKPSAKGYDF
jgi:hypothetical protein